MNKQLVTSNKSIMKNSPSRFNMASRLIARNNPDLSLKLEFGSKKRSGSVRLRHKNDSFSSSDSSGEGIDSFFKTRKGKIENKSRRAMSIDKPRKKGEKIAFDFMLDPKIMDEIQSQRGAIERLNSPGLSNISMSPSKLGKRLNINGSIGTFKASRFGSKGSHRNKRKLSNDTIDYNLSSINVSRPMSRREDMKVIRDKANDLELDDINFEDDLASHLDLDDYSNFGDDQNLNFSVRSSLRSSRLNSPRKKPVTRNSGFSKFRQTSDNTTFSSKKKGSPSSNKKVFFLAAPIEEIEERSAEFTPRENNNEEKIHDTFSIKPEPSFKRARFVKTLKRKKTRKASHLFRTKTFNPTSGNIIRDSGSKEAGKSDDEWDLEDFNFGNKSKKSSDEKFVKMLN